MKIRLQLFAMARDLCGRTNVELEVPEGATFGQLRGELARQIPALGQLAPHLMFALHADYASDSKPIPADAEIACIPPVSGG